MLDHRSERRDDRWQSRDSGGLRARERFQSGATAAGGSSNGGITLSETDVLRAEIADPIGICFDS